jgi:deoxyribonuclease V
MGRAHPRRLGVACHLGLLTGLPTIGVAKSRLCGHHESLSEAHGSQVALVSQNEDEVLGVVLRSRRGVRPLYVSLGHRISLEAAVYYVQSALTQYRLPETTRWADALAGLMLWLG